MTEIADIGPHQPKTHRHLSGQHSGVNVGYLRFSFCGGGPPVSAKINQPFNFAEKNIRRDVCFPQP